MRKTSFCFLSNATQTIFLCFFLSIEQSRTKGTSTHTTLNDFWGVVPPMAWHHILIGEFLCPIGEWPWILTSARTPYIMIMRKLLHHV